MQPYIKISPGLSASREDLGLPSDWSRVKNWLHFRGNVKITGPGILGVRKSKWPKIPVLSDYSKTPDQSFWEKFPRKNLPVKPERTSMLKNWKSGSRST